MSTIHTVAMILVNRILPVQTFLQKYCYLHGHLHHHHHFKQSFITFTHCNFQLFLYYARECPIIPELFSLKLQPIILKIMPAY